MQRSQGFEVHTTYVLLLVLRHHTGCRVTFNRLEMLAPATDAPTLGTRSHLCFPNI